MQTLQYQWISGYKKKEKRKRKKRLTLPLTYHILKLMLCD